MFIGSCWQLWGREMGHLRGEGKGGWGEAEEKRQEQEEAD